MTARRILAYGAIYFLWGGSYLAIRQIVAVCPPFFAAGFRFLVAGLILLAYGRFQRLPMPTARQWMTSALLGLLMFGGNYACLFWSEKYLPSGLAAVLASLIPVWVFLAEWLIARSTPPTFKAVSGILLGVAGVVLIAMPSGAMSSRVLQTGVTKAALVVVLGTLFWSGGTVATRSLDLPKQPVMSAGMQMAWGGCSLLLLSGVAREFPGPEQISRFWDWGFALSMGYLIVAASIVAFTAYVWLIDREPSSRVASYAYVNPVVALVIGVLYGHERPTPIEYAGALLVLAGVVATLAAKGSLQRAPIEAT
jgi:drug/metabolite transporter (DMT)-like permease